MDYNFLLIFREHHIPNIYIYIGNISLSTFSKEIIFTIPIYNYNCTSTFCMVQQFEQTTWKTDKFLLAAACCNKSAHQGSRLQNPHFNLLHRIQMVHLLSLPAMSANLHPFFPMHASSQKVGLGGRLAYIYIYFLYHKFTYV